MSTESLPSTKALATAGIGAGAVLLLVGAWSQSALGDRLLPHAFCITASAPLLWLHALSDSLIGLAYLLIPWCILRYIRLRGDVPFGWLGWLFGAFIVACGATHVFDVITLWEPVYWYSGVMKAFTAFVSLATAWTLFQLIPAALALPSAEKVRALNDDLQREVETRKEAEQNLRLAQEDLERLLAERTAHAAELEAVLDHFFANAPIGMAVMDEGARIVRANPAMAQVTRREAQELAEGRGVTGLSAMPAETVRAIESVVDGGPAISGLVYSRQTAQGDAVLSASYFPIAAPGGRRLTGALVQDITEQRRVERERQQALEAAEAASRAKDEFLARVSHELRSPLQVALVCTEVLCRAPELQQKTSQTVQRLANSVKQQARMIGDLVDISRVLSGKLHLELSPLDPSEPVSAAVEAVCEAATARNVDVRLDFIAGECLVKGDASRLLQTFVNLLDNAIRFSPVGGVVTVTARYGEAQYRITIVDQGPGIATDELDRLFEPFSQGTTQPTQGKGLGLGLAIARGIVNSHGGRIWAESPGIGAAFVVELPALHGHVPMQAREEALAPRLDGLTVLYVEDQAEIGEGMRAGLQSLGAKVELVDSYQAAVASFEARSPDAVLSDVNLGEGPSGLDLARKLRTLPAGQRTLLIALSAYGMPKDHEAARDAGFDKLLVKPTDLGTVASELRGAP